MNVDNLRLAFEIPQRGKTFAEITCDDLDGPMLNCSVGAVVEREIALKPPEHYRFGCADAKLVMDDVEVE
ncbi:unnamed protein product, partial [Iphiclides podalirius]